MWRRSPEIVGPISATSSRRRRAQLAPAAIAAVREFELEDDLDRRPGELSYGRRRLVAIARAVAASSSVLLLDEPAAGLSEGETSELGDLIVRLARELGACGPAGRARRRAGARRLRPCRRARRRAQPRVGHARGGPPRPGGGLGVPGRRRRGRRWGARGGHVAAVHPIGGVAREAARTRPVVPVPDPTTPVLRVRDLAAGYGDLAAVRGIDLEVHPGEVVALLGPNGAGKSTTLLTIAGELPPISGTIECLGVGSRHAAPRPSATRPRLRPRGASRHQLAHRRRQPSPPVGSNP